MLNNLQAEKTDVTIAVTYKNNTLPTILHRHKYLANIYNIYNTPCLYAWLKLTYGRQL